jgi:hypothetical protein
VSGPIIAALRDSNDMLSDIRHLCNAQMCEKLDALRSRLTYLVCTCVEEDPEQPHPSDDDPGCRIKPDSLASPNAAYVGCDDQPIFVWVAEAPEHDGLYAYEKEGSKQNCTGIIHDALQFKDKESCEAWCKANPVPKFEPAEHGFFGRAK